MSLTRLLSSFLRLSLLLALATACGFKERESKRPASPSVTTEAPDPSAPIKEKTKNELTTPSNPSSAGTSQSDPHTGPHPKSTTNENPNRKWADEAVEEIVASSGTAEEAIEQIFALFSSPSLRQQPFVMTLVTRTVDGETTKLNLEAEKGKKRRFLIDHVIDLIVNHSQMDPCNAVEILDRFYIQLMSEDRNSAPLYLPIVEERSVDNHRFAAASLLPAQAHFFLRCNYPDQLAVQTFDLNSILGWGGIRPRLKNNPDSEAFYHAARCFLYEDMSDSPVLDREGGNLTVSLRGEIGNAYVSRAQAKIYLLDPIISLKSYEVLKRTPDPSEEVTRIVLRVEPAALRLSDYIKSDLLDQIITDSPFSIETKELLELALLGQWRDVGVLNAWMKNPDSPLGYFSEQMVDFTQTGLSRHCEDSCVAAVHDFDTDGADLFVFEVEGDLRARAEWDLKVAFETDVIRVDDLITGIPATNPNHFFERSFKIDSLIQAASNEVED